MSLEFLQDTPEVAYRRTISDLQSMNTKIDVSVFESMSIEQIDELLDRLNYRERKLIDESAYGAWLTNPQFMQIKMLQDGLTNLREYREILEESEVIVPGFSYYDGVRKFGRRAEGRTCTYLGEGRPLNWINFIDSIPIMKVVEVVKNGDVGDFRRLYVEIANGRADGLNRVSLQHLTDSTDNALLEMEAYCDTRWEGPWPWEVQAPYRIGRLIEENRKMRQQTLLEMHEIMTQMLREMDESGQESFEITSMIRNMSEAVQKMIEQFAKLAGDAMINLRAAVMTRSGDEGAMKVEHGLTDAVNGCADALARLKVRLDQLVSELQVSPSDLDGMGMGGAPMAGGMAGGMPGDQMGAGPEMGAPGAEMGAEMGAEPPMDPNAAPMPGGENIQPERPRKNA